MSAPAAFVLEKLTDLYNLQIKNRYLPVFYCLSIQKQGMMNLIFHHSLFFLSLYVISYDGHGDMLFP